MNQKEIMLCPICRKRLFDLELKGKAVIEIKCTHCKNVVMIKKQDNKQMAQ